MAASPCALECKLIKIVAMETADGKPVDCHVVFGQVVGVHIDDRFIVDGLLDTAAMKPIARCGYDQYAVVESVFSMHAAQTHDPRKWEPASAAAHLTLM